MAADVGVESGDSGPSGRGEFEIAGVRAAAAIHISWSRTNSQRRSFPKFTQAIIDLPARMIARDGMEM